MRAYQQGDVLIESVDAIPSDAKPLEVTDNGFILAKGETTGHAHRVIGMVNVFRSPDGDVFMKVPKRIKIVHEEHKPIHVPPGTYRIRQVRIYDHFAEEAREEERKRKLEAVKGKLHARYSETFRILAE